ncbi:MAG TPA: FAD:protein FMN transferase [Candidatus Latescibacteria bacterium]|nr:FAD:protein FMN transferase [Candidatus Latescibacterota bacterium]
MLALGAVKRNTGYALVGLALLALGLWRVQAIREPVPPFRETRFLMDTAVTVQVAAADSEEARKWAEEAFREIGRLEGLMGEGGTIPLSQGWTRMTEEVAYVLRRSQHFAELTGGAFDVTVGPLSRLWGFVGGTPHLPDLAKVRRVLASVGYRGLEVLGDSVKGEGKGMLLDLGGAAKGYAVDRAVEVLEGAGVRGGLVEAGGDLRFFGKKADGQPWRIALAHPRRPGKLIYLKDVGLPAVATSGDYQRFFWKGGRRYHHILDPHTGYPARGAVSATAWARTTLDADILSTAFFVLGPEEGIALAERLSDVEGLVIYERGGKLFARCSSGLIGKVDLRGTGISLETGEAP